MTVWADQGSVRIGEALVSRRPAHADGRSSRGEDVVELLAGADPELGEHLVQVVLDGLAADEQLSRDVLVGSPVARHPCDPRLVRGEVVGRLDGPLAGRLARGQELAAGALGKCLGTHFNETLVRGSELLARIDAPPAPAQPFAVEQMRAGKVESDPTAAQAFERLAVGAFG